MMKNTKKWLATGLVAVVAMASLAGLSACGEKVIEKEVIKEVEKIVQVEKVEKAFGFVTQSSYTPYTDLGGYGSDFTHINYADVTLYDDGSYLMEIHNYMYAGAWDIIATETDAKVYGTYKISTEDEYGIVADLSAATRVVSFNKVTSTLIYNDTADESTFTATEEQTVAQQIESLLGSYGAVVAEFDFETHGVTLGEK